MLILFLSLTIFSLSFQNNNYIMRLDSLFDSYEDYKIFFHNNCSQIKLENFYYRGRPEIIENIIANNKYESYSLVYLTNYSYYQKIINNFPKSTIFYINEIPNNLSKTEYCFIHSGIYYNKGPYFENYSNYYIIIYSPASNLFSECIVFFIIIFSIILFNFGICYFCRKTKKCSDLLIFFKLIRKYYLSKIACINFYFSISLSISCLFITLSNLFALIYIIYKSFVIINIIFLLNGYKVIHFHLIDNNKKWKYTIILVISELIITFIFLYIIYFIPSLDNFYLFFIKNIIEHITIFVFLIKAFLKKFILLYRQYRLRRRMRARITIIYRYKLLLYSKVFIFALLYSLGFITMNLIQIFYHINYYVNGFFLIYYMNIGLELFFVIIFGTIFYPTIRDFIYYRTKIIIKIYRKLVFFGEIKKEKEKEMNMSNLTRYNLNTQYLKRHFPLVLVEPFAKTDKILKKDNIVMHIGLVKNE